MSDDFPTSAKVVVIGAGIVGNCLVGHLADMGWTDMVQIDKGPLPNPGGSTGHASNFIFPVDHNKEMAFLTWESQRQYEEAGMNNTCGGIEVARTEERMEELRRRMTSSVCWGVDSRLVTPAEVKEMVPFINEDVILGGFYTPTVSVVDSLEMGTIMRKKAQEKGLQVFANTEVMDVLTEPGEGGKPKITGVVTDKGTIMCDYIAVACGVWSPRIAEMAGATIPLTPAVHQMADVGPIDILVESNKELAFPIIRDMDTFCYERQSAGSMEVGSYGHRAILMHPDDIPAIGETALTPTELPLTQEDFDPQMETAIELMDMLGDAEITYAINGLLSLTPDAMPVLGPVQEVDNMFSAAAVWVKEGPGIGQLVAEWMTYGYPRMCDPESSDIARLYPWERTWDHINARCDEHFIKTYGIVHPREQWESMRGEKKSPYYSRQEELGAEFYDARGWERPQWYNSNEDLVERYNLEGRTHEWDARWWSPIISAEHLQMRASVGMVDLTAFQVYDISGPGAADFIQSMAVNQCKVKVGKSIYTPLLTNEGGFHSDLTMMRVETDRYMVVTGVFDGGRDEHWFTDAMPKDGSVTFENVTEKWSTIGCWGPNAKATVAKLTDIGLDIEDFPYGSVVSATVAGVNVQMLRISYVGENGWEIYSPWDEAPKVWDALREAGEEFDIRPVGMGVYGGTGRVEKGYRLMGSELESEYNVVEAGLARPKVKNADFKGKAAYVKAREDGPAAIMCTLTMEDQMCAAGYKRYPMGGNEPILTLDGERILDSHGRVSRVTTAADGPSVGKFLLMAYLPPEHAVDGKDLQVMYQNELYPVKVASAGSTPVFDPTDARMKS